MNIRKSISSVAILVLVTFAGAVFAANVTVSENVTIELTGLGRSLTLTSTSDALDQLDVTATSFTITTSIGTGSVTITSAEGLDIGTTNNDANIALSTCNSSGSTLVITASATSARTVVVTPSGVICSASEPTTSTGTGGTGGSGSGSGSGTVTPSVTTPATPDDDDVVVVPPPVTTVEGITDLTELKAATQATAKQMIGLMVDKKTYKIPASGEFKPFNRSSRYFAMQSALAASGNACTGDRVAYSTCLNAAKKQEILRSFLRRSPTRCDYYQMLLNAADIPLINRSAIVKEDLPTDIKSSVLRCAQVYTTARLHGIAILFADGSSGAEKSFPRYAGLLYMERTLQAAERIAADAAAEAAAELSDVVVVERTAEGWSPTNVTVNLGDTVRFVNKTDELAWPASAVHPTHEELNGFDATIGLTATTTYEYLFDEIGAWNFHDHLAPDVTGTITVVDPNGPVT